MWQVMSSVGSSLVFYIHIHGHMLHYCVTMCKIGQHSRKQRLFLRLSKPNLSKEKHTEFTLTAIRIRCADITPFSAPSVHTHPVAVIRIAPVGVRIWLTLNTAV